MEPVSMAPSAPGPGGNAGPLAPLPDWVAWVQAGLTALLAVLVVVMLAKARDQNGRIQELQERIQGLENSRALERTTGLEQQLRSTVERLQALERSSARIDVLSAENSALRGEMNQLRRSASDSARPSSPTAEDPTSIAPGASVPGVGGGLTTPQPASP